MKKLKKLLVAFVTLVCSFILFACGTIKVFVNHNGQTPLELTVGKKDADNVLEEINKLEKDGYHIGGVYTDSAYTQVWDGEELKNDQHLYVQWVGNDYNVTYNSNGGTGTMANQTIKYGSSATLTNNAFTKTGYSFAGWATTANAQTAEFANGANFSMNQKGITLYAVWSVNSYAVVFNANNGTGTMANQNANFGASLTLNANEFTRTGYSFAGWNTEADGSGNSYTNGATIASMGEGGITLYAQWQKEKYNIVIKNGTETIATYNNATFGETINASDELGDLTAEAGKTYGGLYLDGDVNFENLYLLDMEEDLTIEDFGNDGATVVLNVRWATTEGTVNLHYDGATGNNTITSIDTVYGTALTELPTPTKTGKTFVGWYSVEPNAENSNLIASKKVTSATVWQDNFSALYAVWANATSAITYNLDNGAWNEIGRPEVHTTNAETVLKTASKNGYDFAGWALEEPAIINGEYKTAGTVIGMTIPANSYAVNGTISLIATWEVQSHTITFRVPNGAGGYTDLLVLEDDFATELQYVDGYDYNAIYTNMTKAGYVFDGWYRLNSDPLEESDIAEGTLFNAKQTGKIYYEDIKLYPNFVAKLSAPTNIAMEQNSTVITWDAVTGADYYLVSIDGDDPIQTSVNELETDLLMIVADTYEIEVKACSNYTGANGDKIDSAYTKIEWTRNTSLQNSIVRVKNDQDILQKYVLFTGNTYTWSSANYIVRVEEQSVEGLVDNTQTENSQNELVTDSTIAVGDKVGTFNFVIEYTDPNKPDETYLAQVVEDVNNISYGETYARYLSQTNATSTQFLDKENPEKYLVGTANGFEVDFVLTKGETSYENFDRTDEELLTYSYEVKDGDVYREATAEEIPTRNAEDGKLYFDAENAGKEYRITVKFAYSKHSTNSNPYGALTQTFELKLNQGVNVYSHEELKAAYGNHEITEINVLRNIVAELSEDQVQADGSPINTSSSHIFDNNDTTSDNATVAGVGRKTDGNVYKRSYKTYANAGDNIVVNGNYCKIDISEIPLVNIEYSVDEGSSATGVNGNVGKMASGVSEYELLRPHIGVFYYCVPFGDGAVFNNLEIVGNKPVEKLDGSDPNYSEKYADLVLRESGSYSAFYIETSKVSVNNVLMYNLHHGVRMDGAQRNFVTGVDATDEANWGTTSVIPNNAKVECNFIEVHDTYCNGVYSWEGKEIKVYNSKFYNLNGPAVQMRNEGLATHPIVVIDKNTVVDNYMTGTESWFSLWGLGKLAGQLKAGLQPVMNGMGASVLNGENYSTNLVFIFDGIDNSDYATAGTLEDGSVTENMARSCYCTVYYGGEKTVIEGETLSTGAKSQINSEYLSSSGDPRVSAELGMYAFGVTPFASKEEFQIAAAITQEFLSVEEKRNATISYAFGLTAKELGVADPSTLGFATWDTIKELEITSLAGALPAGYNKLGLLVTEEQFSVVANNAFEYMVLRQVVSSFIEGAVGNIPEGYTLTNVIGSKYNDIINALANQFGKASDEQFKTLLKAKVSEAHIAELVATYEANDRTLISYSTLGDEGMVKLLLLKFAECESIGTQGVQIVMPDKGSAGSVMVIICEYGFMDQAGWDC